MAILYFHQPDPPSDWLNPGAEAVVSTDSPQRIESLFGIAGRGGYSINTIVLQTECLSDYIRLQALSEMIENSLAGRSCGFILKASRVGTLSDLIHGSERLAHPNLRTVIPLRSAEDALSAQVLSSLGVRLIVDLKQEDLNWELLNDLLFQHLLAFSPRAAMDPFTMLSKICLTPNATFSLASIYFDDFREYLQVDGAGRAYLSRDEMRRGRFVASSASELKDIERTAAFQTTQAFPDRLVSGKTPCAFCEGFALCRGYL
jgi:hypothetical protein